MRRITTAIAAATLLASAAPAAAAPPVSDDAPIVLPLDTSTIEAHLASTPANDDMMRLYPRVAWLMNLGGAATMTCKVLTSGLLDDCHVVSEEPAGMGFGAATLRTAALFRAAPAIRNGKRVEGSITIPMRWQMAGVNLPAPAPPLPPVDPAALALGRRYVELTGLAERMRTAWAPTVRQQTVELVTAGDAQAGQSVMDAFRMGLDDAIRETAERQAHVLALHMTQDQLRAAIAFLQSPAGKALAAAEAVSEAYAAKDFYQTVAQAARNHLCTGAACSAK